METAIQQNRRWRWLVEVGAIVLSLTSACASPTAPEAYPPGWYRVNGAAFYCASPLTVRPIEDGSGACAWCGDTAAVCGPTIEVEPIEEGRDGSVR